MTYNYSALLGKIVEVFGTQAKFSSALGLSEHTVSQKLNGKVQWKQEEMAATCDLFGVDKSEIPRYFFTI